jgi:threonine/homoserine/homoserine lactone efflux protein
LKHEYRTFRGFSPDHGCPDHRARTDRHPGHLDRRNAWRARRAHHRRRHDAWQRLAASGDRAGAQLRHAGESGEQIHETGRTRFVRGLLVALSNPKTIVFFTAFLPQFIDPRLPAGPQLAAMCVASVLIAGASDCAWAVAAGMGRAWFMKPSRVRLLGRLSGTVLIGGGLWLSLARRTN